MYVRLNNWLGEVGAILIVLVCFLLYRLYTTLDKLFLSIDCTLLWINYFCLFMQTLIQHERHVDGVFLTHTQSPEIINFDIIYALSGLFWYPPNQAFCQPKSDKMNKGGAILIGSYSDYYCRRQFYSNLSFRLHFYCFVDSVLFFTSSETSLGWSHRLLAGYFHCEARLKHCEVLLYCMWKGFEASILMFRGYYDGLVFLLIESLPTKAGISYNRRRSKH